MHDDSMRSVFEDIADVAEARRVLASSSSESSDCIDSDVDDLVHSLIGPSPSVSSRSVTSTVGSKATRASSRSANGPSRASARGPDDSSVLSGISDPILYLGRLRQFEASTDLGRVIGTTTARSENVLARGQTLIGVPQKGVARVVVDKFTLQAGTERRGKNSVMGAELAFYKLRYGIAYADYANCALPSENSVLLRTTLKVDVMKGQCSACTALFEWVLGFVDYAFMAVGPRPRQKSTAVLYAVSTHPQPVN